MITRTPIYFYHLSLSSGNGFTLDLDPDYSAALYILTGKLDLSGKEINQGHLLSFNRDGEGISFAGLADTSLILFGGLPLNEKIVTYGPFVMNDFEEIRQAVNRYEKGQMGSLSF